MLFAATLFLISSSQTLNLMRHSKRIMAGMLCLLPVFVLHIWITSANSRACSLQHVPTKVGTRTIDAYSPPVHLGNLENQSINESSGIAASRRNPGMLWTHNDSGDGPFVYAFDRQGKHRGVWRVDGAKAIDWEDMAVGPGPKPGQSYLYMGDIGDNSKNRNEIVVYRAPEPRIIDSDSSSTAKNPRITELADVIRLNYPDGKHDAESLLVHPATGDLYIITKIRGAAAGVYKLKAPLPVTGISTLVRVGEIRLNDMFVGWFTGGDVSPDGRKVVMCDYLGAGEFILPNKPASISMRYGNCLQLRWRSGIITELAGKVKQSVTAQTGDLFLQQAREVLVRCLRSLDASGEQDSSIFSGLNCFVATIAKAYIIREHKSAWLSS